MAYEFRVFAYLAACTFFTYFTYELLGRERLEELEQLEMLNGSEKKNENVISHKWTTLHTVRRTVIILCRSVWYCKHCNYLYLRRTSELSCSFEINTDICSVLNRFHFVDLSSCTCTHTDTHSRLSRWVVDFHLECIWYHFNFTFRIIYATCNIYQFLWSVRLNLGASEFRKHNEHHFPLLAL